ncbi:MAG: condensation domain-containing protein, partial [Xanthomonadales bacterium]|nr:condensation domain-containing protein [Xanthomonadales bacterium]
MASAPKANAAKSAKLKNIEAIYPLSPMQEGMLFHTLMSDDTGIYLMQDRYQVQGHIEAEAYAQAWQKVVDTHPALRTSFAWKSTPKPVQIVHRKTQVPMAVDDLRHLDTQQQEQQIQDWLAEERQQGFDMSKPQLIRFRLVRLGDERFEFIRSFHHILMDAWCISLVTMDFLRHYEAIRQGTSIEIPAPRPYRDYIQWLQKQDHDKAKQFWQQRLAGFNEPTALMIDDGRHQQGQTQGHYAPASVANVQQRFSRAESDALSRFARHAELTLNTVVQGAWSLLLSHYSGSQDVVFGVTVSGRPSQLDAVEEIIGLFINTLPLRVQAPPHQPLKAWLKAIQRNNLEQREFEHTPLVEIQEWAETPKGKALFDSLVVFENAPVDIVLKQQGFSFDVADMEHRVHTNYPITLVLMPEDELGVQITYDEALFDADAVARMLQHLMQLLRQMLTQPGATLGELNPLSDKEQQQLQHWAHSEHQFPVAECWQQAFEQQVAQQAEAIAVCDGTETLSYAQLNDDANRIANTLIQQGVNADDTVAIYGPRNASYLRMIAGILKAGAAYVPLDIHHPQQRIEQILQQSGARLALHSQDHELSFGGEWVALSDALTCANTNNPTCRVQANNLAYVIYTSGSTGTPKGVMVQQQGMLNNILGKVPALGISKDDVIAQTASPCFDISVWQFLAAPALGARVEILVDDIAKDPYRLAEAVENRGISLLEVVPALIPGLIDSEHRLESLRWVLPTGEALPNALCQRWFEHFNIPLMNAYGPAECSDDVAFQPL